MTDDGVVGMHSSLHTPGHLIFSFCCVISSHFCHCEVLCWSGFVSHLSKGIGNGVEFFYGRSVCRVWATFQAYSDDSPLRVEWITGYDRSGRWEFSGILSLSLFFICLCLRFPGLYTPSFLPAGLVRNSDTQVAFTGPDETALDSGSRFDIQHSNCGIKAGHGRCSTSCLL